MKYIIIFEDEDRTLIFKSDDFEEVKNWFDRTRKNLFDLNYTEFYSILTENDGGVAWGHNAFDYKRYWKITVYVDWQIEKLISIGI